MPAGQTIARLVETTGAVLGGLEGIGRALGDGGNEGDAADHLQAAAQGLHTEPERRARRGGQIAHMRAITERLSLAAAEILRILTVLRFYTVNLKIASAGADEFVEFAEDMNLKLAEGSGHVEAFRRQILAMRAHLNDMCALDEVLAGECARVVPAVPDRLIGHVAQLRCWQQALEALSRGAQASITRLQAGVGRALEAIQIGDITRQRLEHVADACERLDSALADPQLPDAAGTRAHMLRLLAAQLEDLTTDFAAQSGVLLAALDGMAPDCDALLGHGEQQSGLEESGLFLRDLDNCIGAAHGMTSQLQRADAKAGQLSDVVLQVAGALRERVQGIENLRFDVDYMAINVNIRARRDSRIGRPVAVIADEIRICSQQLAELTQTVSGMADDLGAVSRSFEAQLVAAGGP
ncbi:MAG TPA: chemotaxis protein, partial [Novosphingobium sp.]|nr:chemotaxis protein [Novosphingobium sp.]